MNDDYTKYRGRCREMAEEAVRIDPTLRLVRGHYYCPIWNSEEQHWWTVRPDGSVYDPSRKQFPSAGHGFYEEFDGFIDCEECGKHVKEEEATIDGTHAFCSNECYGRHVGLL